MMSTSWQDFNQTSLVLQIIPNVSTCTKLILKVVKMYFVFLEMHIKVFLN